MLFPREREREREFNTPPSREKQKDKMSKKILIVLLAIAGAAIIAGCMPANVKASTVEELQAQLNQLLTLIQSLQTQLAQMQGGTTAWCHTFNTNLGIGNKNYEATYLHIALEKEGFGPFERGGDDVSVFDNFTEQTASAVVGFQEKYASEVLKPYGLAHGTGYVGKSTRAKLNKLYGCGNGSGGGGGERACTTEAKLCPDGSSVGRIGPNCEFAQCPSTSCVGEGGKIPQLYQDNKQVCCSGLSRIAGMYPGLGNSCAAYNMSASDICAYCGNGVCGKGENSCNCPSDCKITPATCTDSDGGLSYYVKGVVDDGVTRGEDICDLNLLSERVCNSQLKFGTSFYVCPNGCSNGACIALPVQNSISVVSPNGVEKWMIGKSYDIKWKTTGAIATDSKVDIDLVDYALSDQTKIIAIAHGVSIANNSYTWNITNSFIASNYPPGFESGGVFKVKITEVKSNGTYGLSDESDNYFSIVSAGSETGFLNVSLASDNPVSATIVSDSTYGDGAQALIPVLKLNLSNKNPYPVKITQLKFKKGGLSSNGDIGNIRLFDSYGNIEDYHSIDGDGIITFSNPRGYLFEVPGQGTNSVTLKMDLSNNVVAGKTFYFSLESFSDISVSPVTSVGANLPIRGNVFTTAQTSDLGQLDVAVNVSFPASQVAIQNGAGVFGFGLSANSQKIRIDKIVFTNQGTYGDYLRNFRLMDGASRIGSYSSMDKMRLITFDLSSSPLFIDKGVTKNLKLVADIVGGAGYTFQLGIVKFTDIIAYDAQYGVFIKPGRTDAWTSRIANVSYIIPSVNAFKFPPCGSYGDIDKDDYVTKADSDLALQIGVELIQPTDWQKKYGDVSGDGKVGPYDSSLIQQYIAGMISTFPICKSENLPPVIDGVTAPTQLKANEQGTWTIKAHDPENGYLNYAVNWGDAGSAGWWMPNANGQSIQTNTLQHSYSKAGTYTITITITDDKNKSTSTSISVKVVENSVAKLPPCGSYGDLDQDGYVTKADADLALNIYVGKIQRTEWQNRYGDVSGDYDVGPYDSSLILQYIAGTISTFPICSQLSKPITITSPNGGETWQAGNSYFIKWNAPGSTRVSIDVLDKDGKPAYVTNVIPGVLPNNGAYLWKIPADQPAGDYKVKIMVCPPSYPEAACVNADLNSFGNDYSDNYFSIIKPNTASVKVLSPNGGESYKLGDTMNIKWQAQGISKVIVFLSNETYGYYVATGVDAVSGSYDWAIPSDLFLKNILFLPGNNFKISVYNYVGEDNTTNSKDESDSNFSITGGTLSPCTDTDGGIKYDIKGTVEGLKDSFATVATKNTDYCSNQNTLMEYSCVLNYYQSQDTHTCPNGCGNGACNTQPITPVVTSVSRTSGSLTNGASELYRFKVTNPGSSVISIFSFNLVADLSDYNPTQSNLNLSQIALYRADAQNVPISNVISELGTSTATVEKVNIFAYRGNPLPIDTINSGETVEYILKATVSGAATYDAISTRMSESLTGKKDEIVWATDIANSAVVQGSTGISIPNSPWTLSQ